MGLWDSFKKKNSDSNFDPLGLFKHDKFPSERNTMETYRNVFDDSRFKANGSSNWTDYDDVTTGKPRKDDGFGFDQYEEDVW